MSEPRQEMAALIEELCDLVDFHTGKSDGLPTVKADSDEVKAMRAAADALTAADRWAREVIRIGDAREDRWAREVIRIAGERDALARERDEAIKQLRIVELSVNLEEDLTHKINEMCKYLSMEDGFTLNGIARLLVGCQSRMAADWIEIGRLRRDRQQLREALEEYGSHRVGCARIVPPSHECDCGFEAALSPKDKGESK